MSPNNIGREMRKATIRMGNKTPKGFHRSGLKTLSSLCFAKSRNSRNNRHTRQRECCGCGGIFGLLLDWERGRREARAFGRLPFGAPAKVRERAGEPSPREN